MKTRVYCDERYPDYGLLEYREGTTYDVVEISDEFWAEYKQAEKVYEEMQEKLEKLYLGRST